MTLTAHLEESKVNQDSLAQRFGCQVDVQKYLVDQNYCDLLNSAHMGLTDNS